VVSWLDNPVARHAGRLAARSGRPWAILLLLLAAGTLGALLQRYWMEMEIYSFLRPQMAVRWLGLVIMALTLVALPWAAVRGALLWRRLEKEGHLEEYRRSRLSPASIAVGALAAALSPVCALLALSLAAALAVGLIAPELSLAEAVWAHALLAAQSVAFGALGLWLAGKLRYPAAAIPAAVAVLAAALGAIWALDPFLRSFADPSPWIYAALLPNPMTAVGNALETDVLRFSWIYQRIHAHEYFFVYPPAWQTGGLYLLAAAVLLGLVARRAAVME
jgi:hypothetical protein